MYSVPVDGQYDRNM